MSDDYAKLEQRIGEVKALVETMVTVIQSSTQAINTRIDDHARSVDRQTEAINRRIEDHRSANDKRFESVEDRLNNQQLELDARKHDGKKALAGGGAIGTLAAVAVELLKQSVGK
ncbi:MAG: hypothetical protein C9356_12355 [Oleiphilus sp.]|nr:MAG: hypothetical protein C9356_12355 [Oleiphilus sp.]